MIPLNLLASVNLTASGKQRKLKILAYTGGKLPVDGFPLPVVVDLQGLDIPENPLPILIDHQANEESTIGQADETTNDGRQLVLAGQVTGKSDKVQRVLLAHDAGQKWQASIGTWVTEQQEIPAGQQVEVNGQVHSGPFILARKSVLRETSVLPMGADHRTQVNLAASAAGLMKGASPMTFEEFLASIGVDPTTRTPEQLAALQQAYQSQTAPPPTAAGMPASAQPAPAGAPALAASANLSGPDYEKIIADKVSEMAGTALANLHQRHQALQAAAGGHQDILQAALKNPSMTIAEVERDVLKREISRTRPTSFFGAESKLNETHQPQILQAAMSITRRHRDLEKIYEPKILEAAHRQFRRGIGLQQMLLIAAAANGMNVGLGDRVHMGNLRDVLAYAMPDHRLSIMQAAGGWSANSVSGIISNVANKEILDGYMEDDQQWREIARIKSVNDFKQATSYRMLDNMEYEELGPGGSIAHGKLNEENYTRQAKTYAKMYTIERTQIINDELGAFDDIRTRLGLGASQKLNKVFWTAFINNSSFFTTARGNYIEGATTNLGTDGVGLGLGVVQWYKRTSPSADNSKHVGGTPDILLVPPELMINAELLYKNQNLTAVKASDANIHASKYRPVPVWQLSNSGYTGYSSTAWYLINSRTPPVDVSFLDGQETPTVEQAEADFDQLGIAFRGYHDFGCDKSEYLGSLKSKGAA